MQPAFDKLVSDFAETKERYAKAKTIEEKLALLKIARETLYQAQEMVDQLKSDIDRMKKSPICPPP
jgi:cell shape-determining protein MreC